MFLESPFPARNNTQTSPNLYTALVVVPFLVILAFLDSPHTHTERHRVYAVLSIPHLISVACSFIKKVSPVCDPLLHAAWRKCNV